MTLIPNSIDVSFSSTCVHNLMQFIEVRGCFQGGGWVALLPPPSQPPTPVIYVIFKVKIKAKSDRSFLPQKLVIQKSLI